MNEFTNKSVGIITIFQKFTIKLNKYGRKKGCVWAFLIQS
ncbi:hypothetical protein HMPREF1421_01489 [Helicobacter pylori GAM265BSii]|uniref:Uncharacterized protein n=1 Tax=Helicobacter pylori GAM265BSii TaxID=1159049 RepID=M3NGC8_HELPX|nr:hypothetical protein HMPREF1421_01489 [Helicobacter pylori GAM265BSii]